jgi:hypothetical protein
MNSFLAALEAKYVAEVKECLAVLELYVNKSVGVGEHPDVLTVMDDYLSRLESAQAKLETLRSLSTQSPPENTEPTKE